MKGRTRVRTAALVVGLLAALISFLRSRSASALPPPVQGKNNTVLFLVTDAPGLSNVHHATASALLEHHPGMEVHFASFPSVAKEVNLTSHFVRLRNPEAAPIVFHSLPGFSYYETFDNMGLTIDGVVTPPGVSGAVKLVKDIQKFMSPWALEEHFNLVLAIEAVINKTNPSVVALDSLFAPAIDAARKGNRLTAVISPNMASDTFADRQPWGQIFWRYPAIGSGFAFPVPLADIPANIYIVVRFILGVIRMPDLTAKNNALKSRGIPDPVTVFTMHRPDMPWITASLPDASLPLAVIPPNVTLAGPIVRASAPLEEQDPELATWLASGDGGTVLVNLGSSVLYNEGRATAMALALEAVLRRHTDLKVLWKFRKEGEYGDAFAAPLAQYVESGRLRMPRWINADPYALLETGRVVLSVHHGGANCYSEAVAAGIPHLVLPLWVDLYGYAALVEDLGIGAWAGRGSSPTWHADELSEAFLRVLDRDSAASISMRRRAQEIGRIAQANPGREVAAKVIARLAASGE